MTRWADRRGVDDGLTMTSTLLSPEQLEHLLPTRHRPLRPSAHDHRVRRPRDGARPYHRGAAHAGADAAERLPDRRAARRRSDRRAPVHRPHALAAPLTHVQEPGRADRAGRDRLPLDLRLDAELAVQVRRPLRATVRRTAGRAPPASPRTSADLRGPRASSPDRRARGTSAEWARRRRPRRAREAGAARRERAAVRSSRSPRGGRGCGAASGSRRPRRTGRGRRAPRATHARTRSPSGARGSIASTSYPSRAIARASAPARRSRPRARGRARREGTWRRTVRDSPEGGTVLVV